MLQKFESGPEGRTQVQSIFRLCSEQMSKPYLEKQLIGWARNAFTMLAMMDYPYPTKFMADLPGHPVDLACSYMTGSDKLTGLAKITGRWYYPCFSLVRFNLMVAIVLFFVSLRNADFCGSVVLCLVGFYLTDLLYGSEVQCHDSYAEYVACSDPTGCGTGPDNPPWDYQV